MRHHNQTWRPLGKDASGRDAFRVDMSTDFRAYVIERRWLSWKERLFSWPWRPWRAYWTSEPKEILR